MRVVHVAPAAFGPSGLYGGGERYPLELCRALARHVECRLVTFGRTAARTKEDGVDVRVLRPLRNLRGHPAHPIGGGLVRNVEDADLLHTHHMRSAPSRALALYGSARRRPVVTTDHGLAGGDWAGLLPSLFRAFLLVSQHSADVLGAPPEKVRLVYGGVDVERFHPGDDGAREGVLFVGRLTPHKGIDVLLRALPAGARLTIAGSGGHDRGAAADYPDLLRALARDRDVRFTGPVSEADLAELYRQARVLALPSTYATVYGTRVEVSELLGLTALEAMASGTPVVCSDLGGFREVIRDGENGFLVTPGDVDALRDRLDLLLRDASRARALGIAGRQTVVERFTWDHCAQRCLRAYEEVLNGAL